MIVARRFIAGKAVSLKFLVPSGTTDRLTLAIAPSAVPMGLNGLYWSRILYPAMNHRATFRGSYGTITALNLTPMRLRLHYRPRCQIAIGQSPEDTIS